MHLRMGAALLGVFIILSTISIHSTLAGSCRDRGITVCCRPDNCPQQMSPDGCFCDTTCHQHGDCCDDIDILCPTESCTDYSLRLSGGSNQLEGRVEVCMDGKWGTVCHQNWNNDDARVVCRQLNHPNTGAAGVRNARFAQGEGPIHMTTVGCSGNESSIFDCDFSNETLGCNHGMDAGVICGRAVCSDGEVRLVNGLFPSQGRVEVCLGGTWGSVCDNAWDRLDAIVVCKQLNMSTERVLSVGRAYFGSAKSAINMNDVQCKGTENRLLDCKYNENSDCTHTEDAGVFCGIRLGCIDGTVRLANGSNSTEGRVEICVGSSWSTVCDEGWDNYAASVVCRQLGYPAAGAIAFNGSRFGPGSSAYGILYTNVRCTGHETNLRGCDYNTSTSKCTHLRDAGVKCIRGPGECVDGSIRLSDGSDEYEGRIEVCLFERWGTVCDHSWSTPHAEVVCRQLGLPTNGATAYSGAYFGLGKGPIHIDDAVCTGDESNITQCTFTSNDNCLHSNDAGVRCPCNHGDVRLVDDRPLVGVVPRYGRQTSTEGRVEVCINGVWGTITNYRWDSFDTNVVCRQLGYYGNLSVPVSNIYYYGEGKGPIHMNFVTCRGSESRLIDCRYSFDTRFYSHAQDAGLICYNGTTVGGTACETGQIRLRGGSNGRSGRLEVCFSGVWGAVCYQRWDSFNTEVVCGSLGYPRVGEVTYAIFSYGLGPGHLWMKNVDCLRSGKSIFDCSYNDDSSRACASRFADIGVICYNPGTCTHGDVRLRGSRALNTGRVEICYNSIWGTVSSYGWSANDAMVVCKQLGFFPYLAIPRMNGYYGRGSSQPIPLHNVLCNGREDGLINCTFRPRPFVGVTHANDAGVDCFTKQARGNASFPNCTAGTLRLVGGSTEMEGRVEVCMNGEWGTVCDDRFGSNSANVICRQLGFSGYGAVALPRAHYGEGNGSIYLDELSCTGHEKFWWECQSYTAAHNCRHIEDVSVRCQAKICTDGNVRLADGSNEMEGRIEVCLDGAWGTVCHDFWSGIDAQVVCRQLGYSGTFALGYNSAYFGEGTGPILLDNVHCVGNESRLVDCPHETHTADCIHLYDTGAKCYLEEGSGINNATVCKLGDTRLVNGSKPNEGRIEVCIDNVWGTVCDDRFGPIDGAIACKQLGYSDLGSQPVPGAVYGKGAGPIYMDNTYCYGDEERLLDCAFDPHTSDCSHERDVGVVCSVIGECVTGDIRLVNGSVPTEGRLEVCYEGVWGTITSINFDHNDARVACRQLGYDSDYVVTYGYNTLGSFGQGVGPVHIHNLSCDGNEASLLNCTFDKLNPQITNPHIADAGIRCFNTTKAGCTPGELRLVNGSTPAEGRIEMCLDDVWGTLCGVIWIEIDSIVACRQLGYNDYAALTLPMGSYGLGNNASNSSDVPIYLTPLCNGTEKRLLDCEHYQVSVCDHNFDAALRCFNSVSCTEGALRLVNGKASNEGRIEICQHSVWGTVCDDFISRTDARVVCRNLGFSDRYVSSFVGGYFGRGTGPIHMDDLDCLGTEKKLIECEYDAGTDDCNHNEDAGVACYNQSQCTHGDVRLVGGNNTYEGRLEICYAGLWDSVCRTDFSLSNAMVVCRQLNLTTTYAVPYIYAYYGRGYRDILPGQFYCTGDENRLMNCRSFISSFSTCSHSQDVGVACYPTAQCNTTGETRLVGGRDKYEGRVEICLDGTWGTVDRYLFSYNDSVVVCRSLGFPTVGAENYNVRASNRGNGRVHMMGVSCNGTEPDLTKCRYSRIRTSFRHSRDIGVRCYSGGQCTTGDIRLADGDNDMSGRVEVCVDGVWGTVARTWTPLTSRVICGQLGYSNKLAFAIPASPGSGPVAFLYITCTGDEPSIFNCTTYRAPASYVFHRFDGGVQCFNETVPGQCTNGAVRLVGGYTPMEGRVEVCANGIWKMVCHDSWNQPDGNVVCRELGYGEYGNRVRYASFYGHSDNGFLFGNVRCSGDEERLVDCIVNANSQCSVLASAGVQCSNRSCAEGDIRLVGGSGPNEGRVEVCIGGVWGTVCDSGWGTSDARVACGQLGFSNFTAVPIFNAYFGLGSGPISMNRVGCSGTEPNLTSCTYYPSSGACSHGRDAGIKCFNETGDSCMLGDVRLRGGAYGTEGRVEVCFDGEWGTVCDENWDVIDAVVACNQLGYPPIGRPFTGSFFPNGNGSIFMNNLGCYGDEDYLAHCHYQDNVIGCSHRGNEVGVRCYQSDGCSHGQLRLFSNRFVNYSADGRIGRLEFCYRGVWSTVSSYIWYSLQSAIACRELGLNTTSPRIVPRMNFGPANGPNVYIFCRGPVPYLNNCSVQPADIASPYYGAPTPYYINLYCPQQPCNDGEVRLVNGTRPHNGRVEMCIGNTWGTISDDRWSYADGRVLCRQLGYSDRVLKTRIRAYYGKGKGPIHFKEFLCIGTESKLINCRSSNDTRTERHEEDAGIDCYPNNECTHGEVRLVNGSSEYNGRLEVCNDGVWGTVTSDAWSHYESRVVCRQLGYSGLYALHYDSSIFGSNYDIPIVMDRVFCGGFEENLFNCTFNSVPTSTDTHAKDIGIQCYSKEAGNCTTGDARLVNGSTKYEGTVQVCIGGVWGTVCDTYWSENDGRVVCRQLGYSTAGLETYRSSYFGNTTKGPIYLNRLFCSGGEENLLICYHSPLTESCTHNNDAGVKCYPGNNCTNGAVRLAGSTLSYEGRVEVCVDGVWGTICHDYWDQKDATVVCRQLGLPYQYPVPFREGYFGLTNIPILRSGMLCDGSEANISLCRSSRPFFCTHSHDVGVACLNSSMCNHGDMRLVNGTGTVANGTTAGTIEICYNGVWGTVCDDYWTIEDAKVACRALGLPSTFVKNYHEAYFGEGEGPIFLSRLRCIGTEANLNNCSHSQEINCVHEEDAGVQCLATAECSTEGQLRLVDGPTPTEGRLEVCFYGVWGTVTDDRFDTVTASAICKILKYSSRGLVYYGATRYGRGSGPIHLDNVYCYGTETSVLNCSYNLNTGADTHYEDVGVKCLIGNQCAHGDARLVNGSVSSEGRLEVCIDGIWGTVSSFLIRPIVAKVVCRQLGYSDQVMLLYKDSYFGVGDGPVILTYVYCNGNEANITECDSYKFPTYYNAEVVGVKCYNTSEIATDVCSLGDVRLYGGPSNSSGIVEVCLNNRWGTICSTYLNNRLANTICGQLGFARRSSQAVFASAANYNRSNPDGPVWLRNVECTGSADSIFGCYGYNPDTRSCKASQDIGVVCSTRECTEGQVRLAGGDGRNEGRVEVCEGGKWGTVCGGSWSHREAQVVCRQLGYSGDYASPYHSNVYPGASVPIVVGYINCRGNETQWSQCGYSSDFTYFCTHDDDVGVRCYNDSIPTSCETGAVRLVNGNSTYEGRVEVCIYGTWTTVCDNYWESRDATVVCNQLGYNETGAVIAYKESYFGGGTGEIRLRSLACSGYEASLLECRHTATTGSCNHNRDAGVRCLRGVECNVTGALRLMDVTSLFDGAQVEGRLEMCYNGVWHTIPGGFYWGTVNARVACSQLGYTRFVADVVTPLSGRGPIYSSYFSCRYSDTSLLGCRHSNSTYGNYDHSYDVGVKCYANVSINCTFGSLRLVNGSNEREGRPEVCWNGINFVPLTSSWTSSNRRTVCNYLGFGALGVRVSNGLFGNGSSNVSISFSCFGASSVYGCDYSVTRTTRLRQFDTGIHCPAPVSNCTDGEIRLYGGRTELEGTVEICYGKVWGTINDDLVINDESDVICRQLGFSGEGSRVYTSGQFGSNSSIPIAFDYFLCYGTEERVTECTLRYYGYSFLISLPMGVQCRPKDTNLTTSTMMSSFMSTIEATMTSSFMSTSVAMTTSVRPTMRSSSSSLAMTTSVRPTMRSSSSSLAMTTSVRPTMRSSSSSLAMTTSVRPTMRSSSSSLAMTTSVRPTITTTAKSTSVQMSSSTTSVSTASSTMVLPTNVRENSLTATISGRGVTSAAFNQENFKKAVAASINAYCAGTAPCASRKRDHNDISSGNVMIISVTDIAGGGIKVEFHVMVSSGTSMDADVLERAVNDGIAKGTFSNYGFSNIKVQKTIIIEATPAGSTSNGLSGGAAAGLAIAIIAIVILIAVVVAVVVIIWLKRKNTSYEKEDLVVRSESGFLSNRSSCVEMDVPGIEKDDPFSEKEIEKMREAMSEEQATEEGSQGAKNTTTETAEL